LRRGATNGRRHVCSVQAVAWQLTSGMCCVHLRVCLSTCSQANLVCLTSNNAAVDLSLLPPPPCRYLARLEVSGTESCTGISQGLKSNVSRGGGGRGHCWLGGSWCCVLVGDGVAGWLAGWLPGWLTGWLVAQRAKHALMVWRELVRTCCSAHVMVTAAAPKRQRHRVSTCVLTCATVCLSLSLCVSILITAHPAVHQ
jgi:hypothetical protein